MKTAVATLLALVLIGGLGAYALQLRAENELLRASTPKVIAQERSGKLPFLNVAKVLDLDKHYIVDMSDLRSAIVAEQKKHPLKSYVYFNYLNSGSWIGLNEREAFYAASTIKIPLAMAAYKAVDEGKMSLTDSYELQPADLDQNFGTLYQRGPGTRLTLADYLRIMLTESDNTARNGIYGLFNLIGVSDPLQDVYANLGWDFLPGIVSGSDQTTQQDYSEISVKVLSNMFLALYNATYVSPDDSNQILSYLSQTPFHNQIDAGVPDGVPVAHKVGIAVDRGTYSDCGIVYAPNRNYLLCVGVEGASEQQADALIAGISKVTYDYVIGH